METLERIFYMEWIALFLLLVVACNIFVAGMIFEEMIQENSTTWYHKLMVVVIMIILATPLFLGMWLADNIRKILKRFLRR